jgi:hypothetical protein
LFHQLPPSLERELSARLAAAAEGPPPPAMITGIMDMGSGTGLRVESAALVALREEIASSFHGLLIPQDQGRWHPHITIQNKVDRAAARALQAELGSRDLARRFAFTGLGLHIYRNPHWEAVATWKFRGKHSA